jgi:cobalamin biosynthesis protein CobT
VINEMDRYGGDYDRMLGDVIANEIEADENSSEGYRVFTRDFDVVEVLEPSISAPAYITRLEKKVREHVGPMQRELERLVAARTISRLVSGHRSGRLHGASLHRLNAGDERVFARRVESRTLDTDVQIVVDHSGSMHGHKCEIAWETAFAFSDVLDRLRITNEVIGFTTRDLPSNIRMEVVSQRFTPTRIESLWVPIVKLAGERADNTEVKARFAHMAYQQPSMGCNVDGESVQIGHFRQGSRVAASGKQKRKVMLVLSDGHPSACGEGANFANSLWTHCKRVAQQIEQEGTDIVGIGITDPSVKKFYRHNIVINSVSDLPKTVASELRAILLN